MKNITKLFILLSLITFSCCTAEVDPNVVSDVGKILQGTHEILPVETDYLSFYESDDGTAYLLDVVTTLDGQRRTLTLNTSEVRFAITNKEIPPYLKFRWRQGSNTSLDGIVNNSIVYTIIVFPSIFPIEAIFPPVEGEFSYGNDFEIKSEVETESDDYVKALIEGTN